MRLPLLTVVLAAIALAPVVHAQDATVTTVQYTTNLSLDGIVVAPNGEIYGAEGFNGFRIYKIDLSGASTQVVTSLQGPIDMDFDSTGQLFVTTFNNRGLYFANPADGMSQLVASVNTGPSGIAVDRARNIAYVSHYGSGMLGNGQTIIAVNLETHEKTTFVSGNGLNAPVSLAVDEEGNVYAADIADAKVFRITPAGEVTHIATLPTKPQVFNVGHVAWARGGLYVTGNGGQPYVFRVEPTGEYEIIAGNGEVGSVDGPALMASFNAPNGIAATVTEDSLLVSELNNPRAIRVIELPARSTRNEPAPAIPGDLELAQTYPNPVNANQASNVRLAFSLHKASDVTISLYDVLGRARHVEEFGYLRSGMHEVTLDVSQLGSGFYTYTLDAGDARRTRRLVVVR